MANDWIGPDSDQAPYYSQVGNNNSGSSSSSTSYENRRIGVDIVGGEPPSMEPESGNPLFDIPRGGAEFVGGRLVDLFNLYDTPNRFMQEEVAKTRIRNAMAFGDPKLADKYLNMVTLNDMSIDDVASEMYRDGVAVTGGVPHDLLLSIFADPMNIIMPTVGGYYQRARKSAGFLDQMGASTTADIMGRVKAKTPMTVDDEAFMSKRMNVALGKGYQRISRGAGGTVKALAQLVFGKTASAVVTALGLNTIKKVAQYADAGGSSELFDDAVGIASAHVSRGAAANHVVNQSIIRNSSAVEGRIAAVNRATSVKDVDALAEFRKASALDETSAILKQDEVDAQFAELYAIKEQKMKAGAGSEWAEKVRRGLVDEAVQGDLSAQVGKGGVLTVLDEAIVSNRNSIDREVALVFTRESADAMLIADQGANVAREHFANKLEFLMSREEAGNLFDELIQVPLGDPAKQRRAIIEAINVGNFLHLGNAAKQLSGNMRALRQFADTPSFFKKIDAKIRPLIRSQIGRMSIVSARTMTKQDKTRIISELDAAESAIEKQEIVRRAISEYDNVGAEFQALGDASKTRVTDFTVESFRTQLERLGDLPDEIPARFTKALDGVPEYTNFISDADRLGYKIILEPEGVVTAPRMDITEFGNRAAVRPKASLWVPITDDGMDVVFGNRTKLGKFIDYNFKDRSTIKIMQNTLDRMYEYASTRLTSPLSRALIRDIHREMMDEAFKTRGSLRTVAMSLLGEGDGNVTTFIQRMENRIALQGPEALQEFKALVHNGDFEDMVFYAARGDLQVTGLAAQASGAFKQALRSQPVLRGSIGKWIVQWSDLWYPKFKFTKNPIFQLAEIVESKFFNGLRGLMPEWRIPATGKRFGTKRYYEVVDPLTEKTIKLDSVKLIQDVAAAERPELQFAQDMAALNAYFGYSTTQALLTVGESGSEFVKSMEKSKSWWNGLVNSAATSKANDFWLMTADANLSRMAEELPRMMSETAPAQWDLWLKSAGGDSRGAALLFLHQAHSLRTSRAAARTFLNRHKPLGIGFGRQYDDDPIKNLNTAIRESNGKLDTRGASASAKRLADTLSDVHAGAQAVGYNEETLKKITKVITSLRRTKPNVRSAKATYNKAVQELKLIGMEMETEFKFAVARKQSVRDSLISIGIPKPMATEMASLYVVAQRRGEILPEVALKVERAVDGRGAIDEADATRIADNLQAVREARTGEETVWNTVMDGIDAQIRHESIPVHFYNPSRSFFERTFNHVFFSLYPTSYMFGKVLPEYMRLLYATRTNSLAGLVLTPYDKIIKLASGGKFSLKAWSQFAPLVGFSAAYKIRQSMIREMSNVQDPNEYDPLMFFLTQTLIPGLPTDITVGANVAPIAAVEEFGKTIEEGKGVPEALFAGAAKGVGTAALSMKRVGLPQAVTVAGSIANTLANPPEDISPIENIQTFVETRLEDLGKFLRNE
jgi:hypothetical protein